jgi:hypothetical protein
MTLSRHYTSQRSSTPRPRGKHSISSRHSLLPATECEVVRTEYIPHAATDPKGRSRAETIAADTQKLAREAKSNENSTRQDLEILA